MGEESVASAPPALAFVPVELLRPVVARSRVAPRAEAPAETPQLRAIVDSDESWGERTSLFGDLEA